MNLDVCCYILASFSVFDIVMLTILINRCATLEDELRDTIDACIKHTEAYNRETRQIIKNLMKDAINIAKESTGEKND